MNRLLVTLILLLPLLVGAPVFSAEFQKGLDAYNKNNYVTALREWKPLAEQGRAEAQGMLLAKSSLGGVFALGQSVQQNDTETPQMTQLRNAAEARICELMQQQFNTKFSSVREIDFSSSIRDPFTDAMGNSRIPIGSGVSVDGGKRLVVSDPFQVSGVQWAKWTATDDFGHIWDGGGYQTSVIATADIQSDPAHILALTIGGLGWRGYIYRIYNVPKFQWSEFLEKAKTADPNSAFDFDAAVATKVYPSSNNFNDFSWRFANIFSYQDQLFYVDSYENDDFRIYQLLNEDIHSVCEIKSPVPPRLDSLISLINIAASSLIEPEIEGKSYGSMGYRYGISDRAFDTALLRPWIALREMGQECVESITSCDDNSSTEAILNVYGLHDIWSHRERLTLENHLLEARSSLADYFSIKFNFESPKSRALAEYVVDVFLRTVLGSYSSRLLDYISSVSVKRHIKERQKAVSHGVALTGVSFDTEKITDVFTHNVGEANSLIVDHLGDPIKLLRSRKLKRTNRFGKTFLMVAAHMNNFEVVRALLDAKADVNAKTHPSTAGEASYDDEYIKQFERTALMYAAENASPEIIKLLLTNGADPTSKDSQGNSVQYYLDKNPRIDEEIRRKGILEVAQLAEGEPAPRFDCEKARSDRDLSICGDGSLALYDRELNKAYNDYRASTGKRLFAKQSQLNWLKAVDATCGPGTEKRMYTVCLAQQYRARVRFYDNLLTAAKVSKVE